MTFADYFVSGQVWPPWVIFSSAFAGGLVGMVSHWFKKFWKDETSSDLVQWFFIKNFRGTIYATGAMLASISATMMPLPVESTTLWGAVTLGYGLGWASDSAANGDSPPEA